MCAPSPCTRVVSRLPEVAREFGLDEAKIIKLASNENLLGMPESARLAMHQAVADIGRYPDANGCDLKAEITAKYDVPADWIRLGNGGNDILELAAHAFVQAGQATIYAQYSFLDPQVPEPAGVAHHV